MSENKSVRSDFVCNKGLALWPATLFFCVLVFVFALPAAAKQSERIAAVVNEDVVSATDVAARMRLIIQSSGLPDTAEMRNKLVPQVVNTLIEEELKLQEAEKLDIAIKEDEIKAGFRQIARQNNLEPDQFRQMLKARNIPVETLHHQIRAQIAWSKVVGKKLRPRVNISEADIESEVSRFNQKIGKDQYLVAEIFLPVEDQEQSGEIRELAENLMRQVKGNPKNFAKLATQFSKAAGASKGGDMGWVVEDQLAKPLAQMLDTMEAGQIEGPVRTSSGFHILFLRNKRTIQQENIPSAQQLRQQIGMERLERLQQRHLLDLRTASFIESRN